MKLSLFKKIAMALLGAFAVQSAVARPQFDIVYIDDGTGKQGYSTSKDHQGQGWKWDSKKFQLELENFDGKYIGTDKVIDYDTLFVVLHGSSNKITIPSDISSSGFISVGDNPFHSAVVFNADDSDGRDSLWIGNKSVESVKKDYLTIIGNGLVLNGVGLAIEVKTAESCTKQVGSFSFVGAQHTVVNDTASLTIDVDNLVRADGRILGRGVRHLETYTSKDISIKVGSECSAVEGDYGKGLFAYGSGKIILKSETGYASYGSMRVGENAGDIEFDGKVLVEPGFFTDSYYFSIASNKKVTNEDGVYVGFGTFYEYRYLYGGGYGYAGGYSLVDTEGNLSKKSFLKTAVDPSLMLLDFPQLDLTGNIYVDVSYSSSFMHGAAFGGKKPYTFYVDESTPLPAGLTAGMRVSGTPTEVHDAGSFKYCVKDAEDNSACVDVAYPAITERPLYLTIDGDGYELHSNHSGSTWSYDASERTLLLNGYDGGPIKWEDTKKLKIILHGLNKINIPDGMTSSGIGVGSNSNLEYLTISADDVPGRDSLWIGNQGITKTPTQTYDGHSIARMAIAGGVHLYGVGLGIEYKKAETFTYQKDYPFEIEVMRRAWVYDSASLNIDFSSFTKEEMDGGFATTHLYANTSRNISIKMGGHSSGIIGFLGGDGLQAEGTGKINIVADSVASSGMLVVGENAGTISLTGRLNVSSKNYFSNNDYDIVTSKKIYPAGGFAYLYTYYPSGSMDASYAYGYVDAEGSVIRSSSIKDADDASLEFHDLSLHDYKGKDGFISLKTAIADDHYIHGSVFGGVRPYTFYVDESTPLPEGISLQAYDEFTSSSYYKSFLARLRGTPMEYQAEGNWKFCVKDAANDTKCIDVHHDEIKGKVLVASITVAPEEMDLWIGGRDVIVPSVSALSGTPDVSTLEWSTNNYGVASVDGYGYVTGRSAGSAVITARTKDGSNLTASTTVYVREDTPEATFTSGETYIKNLAYKAKYMINGVEYTSDASGRISIDLSWYKENISIVKLNAIARCNSREQRLSIGVAPSYTVKFNVAGIPDASVELGNKITKPNDPTKTGYKFDGWCKESACTNVWDFDNDVVSDNTNLYAKWTPITYNVVFNAGKGSGTMNPQIMTYDQSANLTSNNFSRTDYGFIGWDTDESAGKVVYENGASVKNLSSENGANINLYAVWKPGTKNVIWPAEMEGYTVTCGGSACGPATVGETYEFKVSIKDGYAVATGSKIVVTVNGETVSAYAYNSTEYTYRVKNVSQDLTITISNIAKKYLVYYKNAKGNLFDGRTSAWIVAGQKVPNLGNITAPGYTFLGWYKDEAGKTPWDFDNDVITGETSIYAVWEIIPYTIDYVLGDDAVDNTKNPTSYNYETRVSLKNVSRAHYNFGGWYYKNGEEEISISEIPYKTTGNLTLYARWSPIEYHVTYNYGDGVVNTSANESHSVYTIETEEYTLEKASKTGYKFLGWFDGNTSNAKEVKSIGGGTTGDVSLFAKFEIIEYKLVFHDVQTGEEKFTYVPYNNTASTFAEWTATGYDLKGWCTDPKDCENTPWNPDAKVTGDLTVYTYWKVKQYSIKFDLNGGKTIDGETSIADIKQDYNSAIAEEDVPADPKREHYTFAGWEPAIPKTIPAGDVTVKAKWVLVKYTIAVSVNDATMGSVSGGDMYDYNTEATLVATAFNGYKFSNWEDDAEAAASRKVTVTGEASYKANFVAATYDVTLNLNGGSAAIDVESYTYGEGATLPVPTKNGYSFAGWFDNEDCEGSSVSGIPADATGEKTFYAKWEKNAEVVTNSSSSKGSVIPGSSSSAKVVASSSSAKQQSSSSVIPGSSSSAKVAASSSSVKSQSSSSVIPGSDPESGSSKPRSSSSAVKPASSSSKGSVIPGSDPESGSSKPGSSSSVIPGSDPESSSSKKDAIVASAKVPMFSVTVMGRNLQIAGAPVGEKIAILDMQGRVLSAGLASTGRVDAANFNVAMPRSGSYMVRIGNQVQRVNVK